MQDQEYDYFTDRFGVSFSPQTLDLARFQPQEEDQKRMCQVAVRVKPLGAGASDSAIKKKSKFRYCGVDPDRGIVHFEDQRGASKSFDYPSTVFSEEDDNQAVFDQLMGQHLANFLAGYNVNFMAYGQTGSGKTYTMIGPSGGFDHLASETKIPSTWGLFPRFLLAVLLQIKSDPSKVMTVSVNQNSFRHPEDLLTRKEIKFSTVKNDYIGHKEVKIDTVNEIVQICRVIEKARATRPTMMNAESSRIHCFMNIKLYCCSPDKMVRMNQCRFVDLCGSERGDIINGHSKMAQLESVANNFNLLLLLQVIQHTVRLPQVTRAGAEPPATTYWKQNPLTRVLKESFNSMAFTQFILCLSQAEQNSGESHYTMEFGTFPKKLTSYVVKPKQRKLKDAIEDIKMTLDHDSNQFHVLQIYQSFLKL